MGVRKTLSVENVDRIGGGVGVTELHHLMSKDEFYGTGKMFAKVVLHPAGMSTLTRWSITISSPAKGTSPIPIKPSPMWDPAISAP